MKFSSTAVSLVVAASAASCAVGFVPSSVLARHGSGLRTGGGAFMNPPNPNTFMEGDAPSPLLQEETYDNMDYSTMAANILASVIPKPIAASAATASQTLAAPARSDEIIATTGVSSKAPPVRRNGITTAERRTRRSAMDYLAQYEGESGAAIVYSKLKENGVTVVNGYSGGAVLPLLDQFHEEHPRHEEQPLQIRWITNSNESSAGHIAEGYAKSSAPLPCDGKGPAGVVVATSGPGVTNLITPLQDAICDGVAMVVLCGQAATTAPEDAFQSAKAVDLTRPCTKWSYQIKSAVELPFVMDYAFFVARHGRPGPVFVDLPKDLQNEVLTKGKIESYVKGLSLQDAKGPVTNYEYAHDENALARIVTRHNVYTGEQTNGIHIGRADSGLIFEFDSASHDPTGPIRLSPVTERSNGGDTSSLYHMDHHPSNTVYRRETLNDGIVATTTRTGELKQGTAITTELLNTIRNAKKPIIIAGQGCNDAREELQAFSDALQIPVTTTLHALGCFDERNDLALNMLGMHGHPTPNYMIQESDLVLSIGSRFDDRITGRMSDFVPEARKAAKEGRGGVVHVDIRITEKAKQVEPTFFVHSTGKNFLRTMNSQLAADKEAEGSAAQGPVTAEWLERKKSLEEEFPIFIPRFRSQTFGVEKEDGTIEELTKTPMSAQFVIKEMNRQLLESGKIDDCIFTTGVGIHQMVAAQLITWTKSRQMLSSGSLGTMGVALGYAIGAKLANFGRIVIAIDGDGSFNMTFTELKSLMEHKIPIKIIILDNESQMMVEYWQRLFHEKRYLAVRNQKNPDYVKLAGAFDIKAIYADSEEELPERMREFLFEDTDKPVLFHVRIERTPCLPLVAPGQPLDNMILKDVDFEVDKSAAPS